MSGTLLIDGAGTARNQAFYTALALALVSGQEVAFRGLVDEENRPRPGLGPGGETALLTAARLSQGEFEGELDDEEAFLRPGKVIPQEFTFDVALQRPSAAPLAPILGLALPALCLAGGESNLVGIGGTHIPWSTTSDELTHVHLPLWRRLGLRVDYTEVVPGFLPRGRGEAALRVLAGPLPARVEAENPFRPARAGVEVLSAGLPVHLSEQALEGALGRLELHGLKAQGRIRRARGAVGMAVLAWAEDTRGVRVGYSALGRRGGRPDAVAIEAVEALSTFLHSGAGFPANLAADLLPLLLLAAGVSRLAVDKITPRLKAAARAARAFFPGAVKLEEPGRPGEPAGLVVRGRGLELGKATAGSGASGRPAAERTEKAT
ncbi:MAG: hypothetical protein KQJ78_02665 [Deltaproteobacteria bacterium]|nr:hypothetical protein [Deltaproteobacteria bacterium]